MKHLTFLLLLIFNGALLAQVDLPITFNDGGTDYMLVDFGGNASSIVVDPTDATNMVVQSIKTVDAQTWAGTTAGGIGLANPIPFSSGATKMTVRVWSPTADTPILLKVENATDGGISVETGATTSVAMAWETLEFDFVNHADGTAALNLANTYNKVSVFLNFGTSGMDAGEQTYYWDDVEFVPGSGLDQVDLPITFEDANTDYALVDFGGNASMMIEDPTDATNTVVQSIKTVDGQTWAGTTVGGLGLTNPIPFSSGATKMTVRVWSPTAGTPIRLKVEDAGDATISVETEATTTMAMAWETLEFDFANQAEGTAAINLANAYNKVSIFFNFGTSGMDAGEQTYFWDDVAFVPGSGLDQVDLPITFEDEGTDYNLVDFGGNASMMIEDPTDATNTVVQSIKTVDGQTWAGTTAGGFGLVNPIPFTPSSTKMTVRVWSPTADTPIRLKVEDAGDATISVETEATTTMAMAWETLEFDFANQAEGTAALDPANTYNKASIFFNFGTSGMDAGEQTYFWDDVEFVAGPDLAQVDLPITFEDDNTDYALVDFGGNASSIIEDPTDATNTVVQSIKTVDGQTWAGTTAGGFGLANPIPFAMTATKMTVRVWSPTADTPIRLKVEDAGDATISVETEATTTMAMAWETLEFDFANQAEGTAALDLANTYNKASIFFNFGTSGMDAGEQTYFWDDVEFVAGPDLAQVDLPITFEDDNTDYALVDFGGNASSIVEDPTDATNTVVQSIKTVDGQTWAGTTAGGFGLANPIPFAMTATKMTVRVWSPTADTPIRLKVEDVGDATISVETEASTTMAMAWETLEFDFANQAEGTAALDLANTYNKASIFFNFGTSGMDAGEQTYFWDDVEFVAGPELDQVDLPITFEDDNTDYALVDFGGNASMMIEDPTDATNTVVQSIKTIDGQTWAGTTAGGFGLANAIPFTDMEPRMTVRVWSPTAGTPIRLKVEDAGDATISVETEAITTVAMAWETLEFDFSNEAEGTAALNLANAYDKVSIFFNFGTSGMDAGEQTYYWDDVQFGGIVDNVEVVPAADYGIKVSPNPASEFFQIELPETFVENVDLQLLNATGQVVKHLQLNGGQQQLSIANLPAGMYVVVVRDKAKIYTQKLMIQ